MSLLSDFFIADPDEVEVGLNPEGRFPSVSYKNVDTVNLANLHHILSGIDYTKAQSEIVEIGTSPSEGPWIFRLSEGLTRALASVDKPLATKAAIAWLKTEEWEKAGATDEDLADFVAMLLDIGKLAKRGLTEQRKLFLWMSL